MNNPPRADRMLTEKTKNNHATIIRSDPISQAPTGALLEATPARPITQLFSFACAVVASDCIVDSHEGFSKRMMG
uniref:Uncharacterized protein n=1 Tax=Anopheles quadriannulatus TaxID=34691 RepID=A0A182XTM0_ANOQN